MLACDRRACVFEASRSAPDSIKYMAGADHTYLQRAKHGLESARVYTEIRQAGRRMYRERGRELVGELICVIIHRREPFLRSSQREEEKILREIYVCLEVESARLRETDRLLRRVFVFRGTPLSFSHTLFCIAGIGAGVSRTLGNKRRVKIQVERLERKRVSRRDIKHGGNQICSRACGMMYEMIAKSMRTLVRGIRI